MDLTTTQTDQHNIYLQSNTALQHSYRRKSNSCSL